MDDLSDDHSGEKNPATLQMSSSSESGQDLATANNKRFSKRKQFKKRKRKKPGKILNMMLNDWNQLADDTAFAAGGKDTIYQQVSLGEFDTILGWANHVTQPYSSTCDKGASPNTSQLFDLPSDPLPASCLHTIHRAMSQELCLGAKKSDYLEAFDQSALVSLGMCLEEIVTASLLPLARAHVEMCDRFTGGRHKKKPRNCPDSSMPWIQPPEECTLELSKQKADEHRAITTYVLPSVKPAVWTAVPGERTQSLLNQPLIQDEEMDAIDYWIHAHGQHVSFIRENRDIFSVFFGTNRQIP